MNKIKYDLILRKLCRIIYFFSLILFLVFLDQVLKFLAVNSNLLQASYNRGISFGLLPDFWWLGINFLILTGIFIFLIKKPSLPLLLIFGGGLSNFIDRIWWGGVIDYIRLPLFPWAFNLADVWIVLGVILILNIKFKILKTHIKNKK